jgi:hypothetical protein
MIFMFVCLGEFSDPEPEQDPEPEFDASFSPNSPSPSIFLNVMICNLQTEH